MKLSSQASLLFVCLFVLELHGHLPFGSQEMESKNGGEIRGCCLASSLQSISRHIPA